LSRLEAVVNDPQSFPRSCRSSTLQGEVQSGTDRGGTVMTVLGQAPLNLPIPLWEDPPGVLRVGKSRVLLELVIHAHQQGKCPQEIVQMYDTLDAGDVYAVIAYYLTHQAEVDEYLRQCDEKAEAIRRQIEATQKPGPSKQELLTRAKARE